MSLAPKIVEVSEFILRYDVDLACITETWLKDRIADGVVLYISLATPSFAETGKWLSMEGSVCI